MPILDEQKLDSINNILYCAIAENKRVCISYQIKSMFRMGELWLNIRKVTILLLFVDICRFECYIHNNKERVNKKPLSSNISEFLVFSTYVLLVSKKFVHFFPLFLCSPYIRKQSVFIQVVFLRYNVQQKHGVALQYVL